MAVIGTFINMFFFGRKFELSTILWHHPFFYRWTSEKGIIKFDKSRFSIAFRMRFNIYHAVLYVTPICDFSCNAEIPLLSFVTRYIAKNHFVRGACVRCMIVPAVTLAWYLQCMHWYFPFDNVYACVPPHLGHTNPFGKRNANRCSRHCFSVPNRLINSGSDILLFLMFVFSLFMTFRLYIIPLTIRNVKQLKRDNQVQKFMPS